MVQGKNEQKHFKGAVHHTTNTQNIERHFSSYKILDYKAQPKTLFTTSQAVQTLIK